jgi:hypothetical protein
MSGWIKLHRKFSEWEWYTNNETKSLFIHLLLKANFEDKKWQGVEIHRGQLITSIKTLSVELKLSEKQIRTAIKNLISTGELASKGTNKWTMLTICKYESYQNEEETKGEQKDKPKANEGRAKGKQRATTKELKELKEDKEVYRAFDHLEIEQHEVDKLIQAGYTIQKIDNILDRIQNFRDNKKYKSLYLTALNWLKSDADKPTGIDKQRLQVSDGMPEHRKGLVI